MRAIVAVACWGSRLLKFDMSESPAASFGEKGKYEDVNYYSNV